MTAESAKTRIMNYDLKMRGARGFTIAELVVVVSLFAILVLFVFGTLIANNRFFKTQSGEIRAINSAREVADRINESARSAAAIASAHTYLTVQYATGGTLVVFQIPAIDSAGEIIASVYDYVIIGRDPNNSSRLIMIVSADAASVRKERVLEFSDKLSAIQLTYDDPDLMLAKNVIYDITFTEEAANPAVERITGSATIRN